MSVILLSVTGLRQRRSDCAQINAAQLLDVTLWDSLIKASSPLVIAEVTFDTMHTNNV